VSVSAVSQSRGVTHQTVYRYFPTQEALLAGTAMSAVSGFLDRLAADLGLINNPTDAVVEGIAYTFEQLPHDRCLSLVMQPGKASAFTAGVRCSVGQSSSVSDQLGHSGVPLSTSSTSWSSSCSGSCSR
jgi:AcrR family transcriptional regulator